MQVFLGLKTLIISASQHISTPEAGLFMLCFLMFVLFVFLSLIFWSNKIVFCIFLFLQTATLGATPFVIAFIIKYHLYPISLENPRFNPFVYTNGFSFDVEIKNKGKLTIKECVLSVVTLRQRHSKLDSLKDILLPRYAYTTSINTTIASNDSFHWQGFIEGYNHPQLQYKTFLECH